MHPVSLPEQRGQAASGAALSPASDLFMPSSSSQMLHPTQPHAPFPVWGGSDRSAASALPTLPGTPEASRAALDPSAGCVALDPSAGCARLRAKCGVSNEEFKQFVNDPAEDQHTAVASELSIIQMTEQPPGPNSAIENVLPKVFGTQGRMDSAGALLAHPAERVADMDNATASVNMGMSPCFTSPGDGQIPVLSRVTRNLLANEADRATRKTTRITNRSTKNFMVDECGLSYKQAELRRTMQDATGRQHRRNIATDRDACLQVGNLGITKEEVSFREEENKARNTSYTGADEEIKLRHSFKVRGDSFKDSAQHLAATTLLHPWFDIVMGVIIVLNTVCTGMEASFEADYITSGGGTATELHRWGPTLEVLEHVFLVAYVIELFMRFFAFGFWVSLRSTWVKLDFILVVVGVSTSWILAPIISSGSQADSFKTLKIVRTLRLTRAVRLFVQFRVLWILVSGLFSSAYTMIWSFLLIFILIYAFAVLGVEIIGTDMDLYNDPVVGDIARERFSSLPDTMVTLTLFWFLDNVGDIYIPLISSRPALTIYFTLFILIVPISCMNLVTSIMVQTSLENAQQDKEANEAWEKQRKKRLLPHLCQLFTHLDVDGSGDITLEEVAHAPEDVMETLKKIANMDNMQELFEVLDVDGNGCLEIDEFCEGMFKQSCEPDKPVELLRIGKQMDRVHMLLTKLAFAHFGHLKRPSEAEDGERPASTKPTRHDSIHGNGEVVRMAQDYHSNRGVLQRLDALEQEQQDLRGMLTAIALHLGVPVAKALSTSAAPILSPSEALESSTLAAPASASEAPAAFESAG